MDSNTTSPEWAGIQFADVLADAVQAEVLCEGIVPSPHRVAEALYRAYAGNSQRDIVGQAAEHVWADRARILAAPPQSSGS